MNEIREYAEKLLKYLDNAPTAFQSVDELEKMLTDAGAVDFYQT